MKRKRFEEVVSARGERAAPGWAAVMLAAPLAFVVPLTGCAETVQPAASEGSEEAQPAGPEGPEPGSDPEAIEAAKRTLEAMGGWQAYERTRYLRFGFVVEGNDSRDSYQHLWDRWTSSYRVEGSRWIDGRLVDRWGYVLQGTEPPRTEWTWTDWENYGLLTLSRTKVLQGQESSMRIAFDPLAALESVDSTAFSNPAVSMPGQ